MVTFIILVIASFYFSCDSFLLRSRSDTGEADPRPERLEGDGDALAD